MAEWLAEHAWAAWMVLAALLAMAEMLTLDFTLLMLAVGALAGGLVSEHADFLEMRKAG